MCADPGARAPIGAIGNLIIYFLNLSALSVNNLRSGEVLALGSSTLDPPLGPPLR